MVEQGKERAEIECIDMTGESSERERNGQGPSPLRESHLVDNPFLFWQVAFQC